MRAQNGEARDDPSARSSQYAPVNMGAVFLLICLPITAALGFILMTTHSEASIGAMMAGAVFLLLCGVIAAGAFRMARGWDEEQGGH